MKLKAIVLSSLISLLSVPAFSSSTLAEGVVFLGQFNNYQRFFYSYNQRDLKTAYRLALRKCRKEGAIKCLLSGHIPSRTWVALAEDGIGTATWAVSTRYEDAYDLAIESCERISDSFCEVTNIDFSY